MKDFGFLVIRCSFFFQASYFCIAFVVVSNDCGTVTTLKRIFQDGRVLGGKRLATSEKEEETLGEGGEVEEEEGMGRPEAKKRKSSES